METSYSTYKSYQPEFSHLVIKSEGNVSAQFLMRDIRTFSETLIFLRDMPYGRNADKNNLLTVFSDHCSTCGPKHALLKMLINENCFKDFQLMLGIFKMNANNSPLVKETLKKFKLEYIPEAHNYLRYKGAMLDITKTVWNQEAIEKDLVEEIEIEADQIADFKIDYHKNFLKEWVRENNIPYNLDEIWAIREQCIRDLSN